MSVDILKKMIQDVPTQVDSSEKSITQLNEQITDLNDKIDTIKTNVCDEASQNLKNYLVGEKYELNKHIFYEGALYNQAILASGNLTDWDVLMMVLNNNDLIIEHFNYISSQSFSCSGNKLSLFPIHSPCDIGFSDLWNGSIFTNIKFSSIDTLFYDTTSNNTIVTISDPILEITHNIIFNYKSSYNDPSDSTCNSIITDWNFGHDYIVKEIGIDGTYGLIDMRDKLLSAKGMIQNNMAKYSGSIDVFNKYIT